MIEDYGMAGYYVQLIYLIFFSIFCEIYSVHNRPLSSSLSAAVIGDDAVVSEGAYVEKKGYLAPGSVLMPGQRIPAGQVFTRSSALADSHHIAHVY